MSFNSFRIEEERQLLKPADRVPQENRKNNVQVSQENRKSAQESDGKDENKPPASPLTARPATFEPPRRKISSPLGPEIVVWKSPAEQVEELSKAVLDLNVTDLKHMLGSLDPQKKAWLLNNCAVESRPVINYAAAKGSTEIVQLLIDNGIDPALSYITDMAENPASAKNGTALHEAIRCSQFNVACTLLEVSIPNLQSDEADGIAWSGHETMKRKSNANYDPSTLLVNLTDDMGLTPFLALAEATRLSHNQLAFLVGIMCERGSDPNQQHPTGGQTLLSNAIERKSEPMCKQLLMAGALVDMKDQNGNTAVHCAARRDCPAILKFILDHYSNMNVNLRNNDGDTPLHMAASKGSRMCILILLDYGADLSIENNAFNSALDVLWCNVPQSTQFFREILDSKITTNECGVNDKKLKLSLDFSILLPSQNQVAVVVAVMKCLSCAEDRLRVIGHPLIETLLRAKWWRLRIFFFVFCFLHFLFVFSLSAHIISTVTNNELMHVVWTRRTLLITASLLFIHIFAQVLLSPHYFLKEPETWLSFTCIILSLIVAITGEVRYVGHNLISHLTFDNEEAWTRHLAAYAVLLAWGQIMFVLSRFPIFGVFALMFFTVLRNVVKVLIIWYCLVIGFALSFYIQSKIMMEDATVFSVIIRTTVMLLGDYDLDEWFPRTSLVSPDNAKRILEGERWQNHQENLGLTTQIIFLLFIFLGSIVLVNLMIGMAVSDIQGLSEEGNLRHMVKQAEFMLYMDYLLGRLQIFQKRKTMPQKITITPNQGRRAVYRQFRRQWLDIPNNVLTGLIEIGVENAKKAEAVITGEKRCENCNAKFRT